MPEGIRTYQQTAETESAAALVSIHRSSTYQRIKRHKKEATAGGERRKRKRRTERDR